MESSTPPSQLPIKTSYRGITSDQMVLTKTAMNELRTHLSFTQLRFHCTKKYGRTFHVTTAANSTGEAVVQYFSGQTDVQPASCGSYVRMKNDNSASAGVCQKWGFESFYWVTFLIYEKLLFFHFYPTYLVNTNTRWFRTRICVWTGIKEHSLKPLVTAVYLLFTTKQTQLSPLGSVTSARSSRYIHHYSPPLRGIVVK